MAENKLISELSGITNPSLTGYTVYDDGITTYRMALSELTAYVTAAEGDFATTGSNIFNGSQTINGSIIISGSDNIHTKPSNPVTGMTRNMSSYNTFIGSESIPQKSDNMQFSPTVSYNIGAVQGNTINFYGPNTTTAVWNVLSNLFMGGQGINFGTLSNPMDKISGSVQLSANILNNGTINVNGYSSSLSGPFNLTSNLINGGLVTLNAYSSSINFNSNIANASISVDNSFTPISGTPTSALSPRVNFNLLYGNNHKIIFSGSNTLTGQTKTFNYNLVQGEFITASIGSGDSSNISNTAIVGNSLVVSGSSTMVNGDANNIPNNTYGSAFFGRFNSLDGNKSKTAETIFAVGTGTQTSRKTGFLIDSGSNTHIDGTFNVTGSSTFLGTQIIKDAVIIGPSGSRHTNNPEMLHVQNSGSFNIAHLQGNIDSYLQINVKNESSAAGASSDFVATADNGTEDLHYVNMGINSSGFLTPFSVGYQNDAYLINRGRDLYIGSLDGPDYDHTHVHLFSSNSWQNPQISIISEGKIGFNTGSVTTGYTYEFSGSAKFVNNIQATTIVGSGDLNLLTDGENVNILGSNLVIPNGGINTSFNLTSVGASISQVTNIDSVTEKLVPYNATSTGITHNFLSGSIAYVSNPSSDFVIDVVETPITNNKAIGLTVIVEQGTPAYKITGLKINSNDEGSVSINWFGGIQPTGTTNSTDIFAFSLIKVNNTWRVLGQKTTF
jgi:hypothetical protein